MIKKLSKSDAHKIIKDALNNNAPITERQLKQLLLYFAPALPKKPKDAFDWVALAASKNDARLYLNGVHVIDGVAYASNGHRIHRAAVDMEDGFYCPKTRLKFDDEPRPPFERLFPKGSLELFPVEIENVQTEPKYKRTTCKVQGVKLNLDYVNKAMGKECAVVDKETVYFCNDFGGAVIAGIRE